MDSYTHRSLTAPREFGADIKTYARAINRSFARAILDALPRHIRDRIYSQLLLRPNTRITVCDAKLPRQIRCGHNYMEAHQSFWKLPQLKHYYDPLYVGEDFAREVAEAHYSTSTFYFDYHELYLTQKFLTVDRFGYGFKPMELVRSVELVLDPSLTCVCNSNALAHHDLAPGGLSYAAGIQRCLEQLLGLASRSVRIKIIVLGCQARSYRLRERSKEIYDIVYAFLTHCRERGFRFAVEVFGDSGSEWSIDDTVEGGMETALQRVRDM